MLIPIWRGMQPFIYGSCLIHCTSASLHLSLYIHMRPSQLPALTCVPKCNTLLARFLLQWEADNGLCWKIQYHPASMVSFSQNGMLYILINNVVVVFFILFVCSRLEEKLFKINMRPPAFRVGSEWVGGKIRRKNKRMAE